jgi:cyclopropane fatty-acyl-phospholipid synthase-like methyltransferase
MEEFSQAADNNKAPILRVLMEWLSDDPLVLEVGSGAGQHAIHMASALEGIRWQPTDRPKVLPTLIDNVSNYGTSNILTPIALDLSSSEWHLGQMDCVYSANVIHIVSEALGENLIRGAAGLLAVDGLLTLYGPFKYRGKFTTASNADFHDWLKARDPESGVRDFEWVCDLAKDSGLSFAEDRPMPANNQFLAFRRLETNLLNKQDSY